MNAEVIAVGSELLTPQRFDTNSLYLTAELNNLGVEVKTKSVVGDDRERIAVAVRIAAGRSEIVVVTGGLGPTEDDVTREAVAMAIDRKLTYRPELAEAIERRFARLKRKMAEINRRQAFVIDGSEIMPNDCGTAPGLWIDEGQVSILLLPGPPGELKPMFERHCIPRLLRRVPKQVIRTLVLRVANMPESDLDQLIAPVYTRYTNPATTILAAAGDIQIHLRARSEVEQEAVRLLNEVGAQIEILLGDRIYSRNGEPLETAVGRLLREAGATVAVAESMTGGGLAERITSVPGSSSYFLGGFLTYTDAMKRLLGVSEETLTACGSVSAETAEAMAAGARRLTGATYALSITGVAGPEGGREAVPVGTTYIGLADAFTCQASHRQFPGDRSRVRGFAIQMALDLLRRKCRA